jgi:hypothetical protein
VCWSSSGSLPFAARPSRPPFAHICRNHRAEPHYHNTVIRPTIQGIPLWHRPARIVGATFLLHEPADLGDIFTTVKQVSGHQSAATMKPPAEVAPRIFSSLPHRGVLRRKRRLPQRPCRSLRDRAVEEGRVLLQILQYRLPPAICCIGPHLSRESPSQPMMPLRLNPSHRLWHHSPSQSQPPFRSGMLFRNAGRGPPPNLSCGRSKHNCACGRIGHRACREASPRRHSSGILATSSRPCGKAHDRQQGVREFWTLWCKEHVQSFSF